MQPAENYVIVITGDIVDNANHPEFAVDALTAFSRLADHGFKILAIPGNHDYGTGIFGNEKFVTIFKEKFYKNTEITYPKLDLIDDMAFIGLDSTAEELHWLDRILSQGELGKEQLGRLNSILEDPEMAPLQKVVYLHHHPFDFKPGMRLKDNDELKDVIENRVDILLFGHYHADPSSAGKVYNGKWGIRRCYNAGSSTHKNDSIGFHRVIDPDFDDPSMDFDGAFI
jgi:3',5'-cyclic AMP phosphodiesterase CpdA